MLVFQGVAFRLILEMSPAPSPHRPPPHLFGGRTAQEGHGASGEIMGIPGGSPCITEP